MFIDNMKFACAICGPPREGGGLAKGGGGVELGPLPFTDELGRD